MTDSSGIVERVGPNVTVFKSGDRVLAGADGIISQNLDKAAFQTYTIAQASSVSKLPSYISLEQAATLPTGIVRLHPKHSHGMDDLLTLIFQITSYLMLFHILGLPKPGSGIPAPDATVLVWGGASIVGNLAIQFAHKAGLNVYTTASEKNHEQLRSLGARNLFDYHSATVVEDIVAAAEREGKPIAYVVDAITSFATLKSVQDILVKSTATEKKIAHTSPWPEKELHKLEGIDAEMVHGEEIWFKPGMMEFGRKFFNDDLLSWLENGVIIPPPYRIFEGGVGKLQTALDELKAGVSNQKLLVKV